MLSSILKVAGNLSGYFSPERIDKRKRRKIEKLEDEYKKLFQETSTPNNRARMQSILEQLSSLQKDLRA